jgi:hypothetical protein
LSPVRAGPERVREAERLRERVQEQLPPFQLAEAWAFWRRVEEEAE